MAGRLTAVGSHILGGHGAAALRHRAGMALPVGKHIVPDQPLPVSDELVWDNGTPYPEPCVDRLAPRIGKYEALAWLCGGLGFFAALGLAAALNDKASKKCRVLVGEGSLHYLEPMITSATQGVPNCATTTSAWHHT